MENAKTLSKVEDKINAPFSITHDGKLIIAKDQKNSGTYAIFDAATGNKKQDLVKSNEHVYFSGITPDDKYYVLLVRDFCKIFELPSGKEVKTYESSDMDNIIFLDQNSDGKYVHQDKKI